ncbi:hypothetical protein IFM89_029036 [Coptis chinensis]|uniref:Uncharacterized protein n=1 Tax=Coptis chinensis TaxID=261450 RepID=A0A835IE13_9MAGN|nr:hypothetical protein IFM89_029036 [Coptis chinensis]
MTSSQARLLTKCDGHMLFFGFESQCHYKKNDFWPQVELFMLSSHLFSWKSSSFSKSSHFSAAKTTSSIEGPTLAFLKYLRCRLSAREEFGAASTPAKEETISSAARLSISTKNVIEAKYGLSDNSGKLTDVKQTYGWSLWRGIQASKGMHLSTNGVTAWDPHLMRRNLCESEAQSLAALNALL